MRARVGAGLGAGEGGLQLVLNKIICRVRTYDFLIFFFHMIFYQKPNVSRQIRIKEIEYKIQSCYFYLKSALKFLDTKTDSYYYYLL